MKVALLFVFAALAVAKECGKNVKGCSSGKCCSYWGYCGTTSAYCGSGKYQCVCDCKGKKPCKSSSSSGTSSSAACTNYKTTSDLNVRSGPGTNYAIKKTVSKGATVCVVSTSNGWAKLKDGKYVSAKYIQPTQTIKTTTPTTPTTSKNTSKGSSSSSCTNYKTTASLNVRSGPGTNYSTKKTLSSGTTVCVVSTSNGWAKLKDGTYVSATYLERPTPSTTLANLKFNHPAPNVNSLRRLSLWATGYYTPVYKSGGDVALRTRSGQALAYLSRKQWCACAMEGSCAVKTGSKIVTYNYDTTTSSYTVNCGTYYPRFPSYYNCKTKFRKAVGIYGDGAAFNLVPFRSIAVDRNYISYGTVLYIPKARGTKVTLPDGTTRVHDGYFIAADTGGAIKGTHIDVFFGSIDPVQTSTFSSWVTASSSRTFAAYVVKDQSIINEIKTFSKGLKN